MAKLFNIKKYFLPITCFLIIMSGEVWASQSTSYKLSVESFNSGCSISSSSSYKHTGDFYSKQLSALANINYTLGEGFMHSAYFAAPVFAPIVTAITPNHGNNSGTISITDLHGANFVSGATVKLKKTGQLDIIAINVMVVNSGQITCIFDLTEKASGAWNVEVTNPDSRSGSLPGAFTINYPAPGVYSITPSSGNNDSAINITNLSGQYFRTGAQVKLEKSGENDILATNIVVVDDTKITCRFDIRERNPGPWDVVVINNDDQRGTLSGAFKIESPYIVVTEPVRSTKNPFNPLEGGTTIKYSLSRDADITVMLFSMRGEKVWQRTFPAGTVGGTAGSNEFAWDGMTDFRSEVSFGVYILLVTTRVNGAVKEISRTKIAIIK